MYNISKTKIYLVYILFLTVLFVNLSVFLPKSIKESSFQNIIPAGINLGLDLRGGSYILLEVEIDKAINRQTNQKLDYIVVRMSNAMRNLNIKYSTIFVQPDTNKITLISKESEESLKKLINSIDSKLIFDKNKNEISIYYPNLSKESFREQTMEASLISINKRIDGLGVKDASITRVGKNKISISMPGAENPDEIKKLIGKTAKLEFYLVQTNNDNEEQNENAGKVLNFSPSSLTPQKSLTVEKYPVVEGKDLINSNVAFNNNQPIVSFTFNYFAANNLAKTTSKNIGKQLAIVLDNEIISSPIIQQTILDGNGMISGLSSLQEAKQLSILFKSGTLPAPISIIEERVVGASLGEESIYKGKIAVIIALLSVMLVMISIYGKLGLIACISLIFNLLLLTASLHILGATLTLPGIAGIALNIGMLIDSNILIFEKMRDEFRSNNKNIIKIATLGFNNSWSGIVDANITTIIATFLLFLFGTGPIQGFAITLSLGTIFTLFTTLTISKLIIFTWLNNSNLKQISFLTK